MLIEHIRQILLPIKDICRRIRSAIPSRTAYDSLEKEQNVLLSVYPKESVEIIMSAPPTTEQPR